MSDQPPTSTFGRTPSPSENREELLIGRVIDGEPRLFQPLLHERGNRFVVLN